MTEVRRQNERLVVLPIIGFFLLNYPLLSIFSREQLLFGVPVFYLYLFLVWFLYIVCVALLQERSTPPQPSPEPPKPVKTE